MPEDAGQVPNATPPQVGTTETPTTPPAPPPTGEPTTFDAAYVAELRKEAAQYRTAAKKAEAEAAALKQAQMTEEEKRAAKLADLEKAQTDWRQEKRALVTRAAVERQARALGIVDEEVAYKLLDQAAITYDEAGNPQNLEKLLTDLVTAKPFLKAAVQQATGGSTANPGRDGAQSLTPEAVIRARMAARNQGDPFNLALHMEKGGGVFVAEKPPG